MKRKITHYVATFVFVIMLISALSSNAFAMYFFGNDPGTWKTYINASQSFSSNYYTDAKPDMRFEYKNLECDTQNAKLEVTLYAKKVHWYNILWPSESSEGTVNCLNINGTPNVWYGYTYQDVDCSSVYEIEDKWPEYILDECPSIRFFYEPIDNNSKNIHNDYGEWLVICSY